MSFDMGPMGNLSNVQKSAKTMDGGGGNTGYFSRRGEEGEENIVEFAKDYPKDSFERVTLDEINGSDDKGLLSKLIAFLKKILKKIKLMLKK